MMVMEGGDPVCCEGSEEMDVDRTAGALLRSWAGRRTTIFFPFFKVGNRQIKDRKPVVERGKAEGSADGTRLPRKQEGVGPACHLTSC